MAPKKGQGKSKGKQPAKHKACRPSPSALSSSSDEEAWPVWEKLHLKIAALEKQRAEDTDK